MLFTYENAIGFWINRASFLLRKELTRRFSEQGFRITAVEWAILVQLWADNPQTTSELTDRTIRDRTTVTRLLDGMEKKRLIKRARDRHDRRRVIVSLAKRGRDLETELVPIAQALMRDVSKEINNEQVDLTIYTLQRICDRLIIRE